ncbi:MULTISPECIES: thioredoxin family protein [Rhodopseudomonas]|uniref:Thioredoxin n=1 Tax=Rhodopseudomonas palustris TaxID=1076 RepID=A0A0D7ESY9_RHOPL|nr:MULTISPECIES: thioredoxin family protein [Rhodopseudomonas]KIZ43761.1 thioredoxin [Rhodopseudomonas palustris]MDF3810811.1 thioredoxin family protein [Rhodopseudomonas sp. BAL398]WOK17332.1 thioredoxin family protein [Rhodopseudomonas sp. BAL398]
MIAQRLTRRHVVAGLAATGLGLRAAPSLAAPVLGDDGLYQLDWYLQSFLDLPEDLAGATAKRKRFAILWGLKGCPFCRRMHEVHMMDPAIEGYIRDNFEVLHLNHIGAREVTDFDGRKLSEKAFAQAYGIRFTPTVQFFPESADGLAARQPQAREVARMPGLLEPPEFLAMFKYVKAKGYETMSFPEWLKKPA